MFTICLHHNDQDGRCAAAIVRRALGKDVRLYEINYGEEIPWEAIQKADRVVIVDFSLPLDDMLQVQKMAELIWVDHHVSSFDALSSLENVAGERNLDDAACVLTWRTFLPQERIPRAVNFIGDRDVWRFAFEETAAFCEGLFEEDTQPANDKLWEPLLNGETDFATQLIERGRILLAARLRGIKHSIRTRGFPVDFEGFNTLAINIRGNGDIGEYIRNQGYAIAYCYHDAMRNPVRNDMGEYGRLTTFVTLYSAGADVSKIAGKFGGGGHPGAAGFSFLRGSTPFPPGAKVVYE